eukprot:gene34372-57128_t
MENQAAARSLASGPLRRRAFLLTAIALLCALCAPFFVDTVDRQGPKATRGVVSYASLGSLSRPVELKGEWRLDWHTAPAPGARLYIPVPSDWKGAKAGAVILPELGAASYSLTVRDLPAGRYTLYVPRFFGAVRVVIDGQVVSERGVYGLSRANSRAVDRSQDVTIVSTGRDIQI